MNRQRIFILAGIGTLIVLAIAIGAWLLVRSRQAAPVSSTTNTPITATTPAVVTIKGSGPMNHPR